MNDSYLSFIINLMNFLHINLCFTSKVFEFRWTKETKSILLSLPCPPTKGECTTAIFFFESGDNRKEYVIHLSLWQNQNALTFGLKATLRYTVNMSHYVYRQVYNMMNGNNYTNFSMSLSYQLASCDMMYELWDMNTSLVGCLQMSTSRQLF